MLQTNYLNNVIAGRDQFYMYYSSDRSNLQNTLTNIYPELSDGVRLGNQRPRYINAFKECIKFKIKDAFSNMIQSPSNQNLIASFILYKLENKDNNQILELERFNKLLTKISDTSFKKQKKTQNILPNEGILKGKSNGQCKKTLPNGAICEGVFQNDQLNGQGKKTLLDGTIYEGEFKDDELNGQGKLIDANGQVIKSGKFENDELNGQGKCLSNSYYTAYCQAECEGEFKDGALNGVGKKTYPNGTIYEGNFKYGTLNGQGKITLPDGTCTEGEFKYDTLNGQGKITLPDGTCTKGEFRNGELI